MTGEKRDSLAARERELSHGAALPASTKGLPRPDRKQLAYRFGFLRLSRRECIEQLVHKELLIRELKDRLARLEGQTQNDPLVSSQEVALLDRTGPGGTP